MERDFKRRQEEVLDIIIRTYIETAEPVGSRYVAKRLNLSSATIRNVMSDLEEMGLITHPHTSAGRIPTDKGYRYYIEYLMHLQSINKNVMTAINDEYHAAVRSVEDALERTSHLLSSLTNYVGISLYPQHEKVYLDGASHILEQPEFKDFRKLYHILKYMEEKRALMSLLEGDFARNELTIHIGKELKTNNLIECSIVTRGYKIKGKPSGRVGVIGPKRMVYDKVIPTIETLADALTNILDTIEE